MYAYFSRLETGTRLHDDGHKPVRVVGEVYSGTVTVQWAASGLDTTSTARLPYCPTPVLLRCAVLVASVEGLGSETGSLRIHYRYCGSLTSADTPSQIQNETNEPSSGRFARCIRAPQYADDGRGICVRASRPTTAADCPEQINP